MSIEFAIPSMRPNHVIRVLHDLNNQTLKPTKVILVDNSSKFVRRRMNLDYDLEVINYGQNVGPNAVWNLALRLNSNFCGILGDDLRLDPTMVEKMVYGLFLRHGPRNLEAGVVVPRITQTKPLPNTMIDLSSLRGECLPTGKGQAGAVLMRKEIAHQIPEIPSQFKIFFGDNWISEHVIKYLKMGWIRLTHCYIYHKPGPSQVSANLDYKIVLKNERKSWTRYWSEHDSLE